MKQQKVTWFSWKKVLIIIIMLLVLILSIYFYVTFQHIKASKRVDFDKTEAYILEETDMEKVDDMFMFQNERLYHIAFTRDKQGKQWIQFYPTSEPKSDNETKESEDEETEEENNKEIVSIERDNTLSQQKLEALWKRECKQCELTGSSPAILEDVPLWELTYTDNKNRYVIEYRQLEDGEVFEQLKLNQTYKMTN